MSKTKSWLPEGMRYQSSSAAVGDHGQYVIIPGGLEIDCSDQTMLIESDYLALGETGLPVVQKGRTRFIPERK